MKNYKRGVAASITFDLGVTPDAAPTVKLVREYGDTAATGIATSGSGSTYTVPLTTLHMASGGVQKLIWSYTLSAVAKTQTQYINVYTPYITKSEFFNRHEELEDEWSDRFDEIELKVRNVINGYCAQEFEFRPDQSLTFDGPGTRQLFVTRRLETLTSIIEVSRDWTTGNGTTSDVTTLVEVVPDSKLFVRAIGPNIKLSENSTYTILGDWGWPYVPQNVTDAADLILEDWLNDDSNYRRHGIKEVWFDRERMQFDGSVFASTGNLDADVLLFDYTQTLMEMI